jgi:hypothetical protein
MKRISVILSIAAFAALAAPLSAQDGGKYGRKGRDDSRIYDRNGDGRIDSRDRVGSNCSWWDVNCNGVNTTRNGRVDNRRVDNRSTGWQLVGRDLDGNAIYERRTVDKHGKKMTIETARRMPEGRMKIIDKRKVNDRYDSRISNGRIYDDRDRDNDGIDDRYERDGRRR